MRFKRIRLFKILLFVEKLKANLQNQLTENKSLDRKDIENLLYLSENDDDLKLGVSAFKK